MQVERVAPRHVPVDPSVDNKLQPGHDSPEEVIRREEDRLAEDKAAFKSSEVWRRIKRLNAMKRARNLARFGVVEIPNVLLEIQTAADRLRLSANNGEDDPEADHNPEFDSHDDDVPVEYTDGGDEWPEEAAIDVDLDEEEVAPRRRKVSEKAKQKSAFKRSLTKAVSKGESNGIHRFDLSWAHEVTLRNLGRVWHILKPFGYDVEKELSEDGLEETYMFIAKDGTGFAFHGLPNADFIFDLFSFDSAENETLTRCFVQRNGMSDSSIQGVPLSFDSEGEDEIVLTGMEARSYIQGWHSALNLVSSKAASLRQVVRASTEGYQPNQKDKANIQFVLSTVLASAGSASSKPEKMRTHVRRELACLGVLDHQEMLALARKTLGDRRIKRLSAHYTGCASLLVE